jgi:6,7-dimethyl-8-ribityllumazine synthase
VAGRAPRRPRSVSERPQSASRTTPSESASRRGPASPRFAIVAARFNERITTRLVDGARQAFRAARVKPEDIEVHWVPGSYELPQAAAWLASTRRYAGIACVGVIIRGQTPHFEHVAREAAAGIRHVALTSGIPVTFGVVTALDEQQAWARAGGEVANRGEEAAEAALEMAEFAARLRGSARNGRLRRDSGRRR